MKGIFTTALPVLALIIFSLSAQAQTMQGTDRLQGSSNWDPSSRAEGTGGNQPIAEPPSLDSRRWVPPEDRVLKKGLLAPSAEDRTAYAAFLRTRNTGLLRLLPREFNDSEIYHAKNRTGIRGGGAYYSFVTPTHQYGYGSDLELDHNRLSVGFGGLDYGMMTNLGDVLLAEITLDDPSVQSLANYQVPRSEQKAREEQLRFSWSKGVMLGGLLYFNRLPVQEKTTYLLCSINYRKSDVLVAFRVVRRDYDGSLIILWKILRKKLDPRSVNLN